jgi:hypothetical protein
MGTGKIPDVNDYKWELLRHHERLLSKQALTSWDLNDNAAVALRSRNRRSPNLCRATSTLTASLTRPVKLAGTLVSASPQAPCSCKATPIATATSITLISSSGNVTYAAAGSVPEPSTVALLALATAGWRILRAGGLRKT